MAEGKESVTTTRSRSEWQQKYGGLPKEQQPAWTGFNPQISPLLERVQGLDEVLKASLDAKAKIHAEIERLTELQKSLGTDDFIGKWIFGNKIGELNQQLAQMDATSAIGKQEMLMNQAKAIESGAWENLPVNEEWGQIAGVTPRINSPSHAMYPTVPTIGPYQEPASWRSFPQYGGGVISHGPATGSIDKRPSVVGGYPSFNEMSTNFAARQAEDAFWTRVLGEQGASGASQASKLPMPSWLTSVLEPSMIAGKEAKSKMEKGTETGAAFTPRPLGAQAELTPAQLQQLALYGGWGQSGATLNPDEYIANLSNVQPWFEQYQTLSKKLAPKSTKLAAPTWSKRN